MSNILGNMPPVFGSGYRGVVPAPSAADVSAQNILRADGTWGAQATSGPLPSQTGNAGELLTTDGTNASWASSLNTFQFGDVTLGTSGPSVKSSLSARAPRQGLVFDGTAGSTVSGPTLGTSNFTAAAWVNISSLPASAISGVISGATNSLSFGIGTTGAIDISKTAVANVGTSTGTITAGKQSLIVYSRSGTTGTFYINGVASGTVTDSQDYSVAQTLVGSAVTSSLYVFPGVIIPLIYNRALSASEVVSLYEAGAPAGADYNSASNTAINSSAWVNTNYTSFSGASATGFTAVKASSTGYAESRPAFSIQKGQKFRFTGTLTLNNGKTVLPYVLIQEDATAVQIPASGSFDVTVTAGITMSGATAYFRTSGDADYTVSNVSVTRLGLLLAPDAAQAGGGLVWYDTSGNAANITLPASGVTWNVPTSSKTATGWRFQNGAAVGLSVPSTFGLISSGTDGANIIAAADGNMTVTLNARSSQGYGSLNTYNYGTSTAFPLVVQGNGGNFLLGTTTDSGNGKLQLATHTTSAGGIGFGTALSLFTITSNALRLSAASGGASFQITQGGAGTVEILTNGTDGYYSTQGSAYFRTNTNVTALTLDSSQRTILSGALRLANAYVATPQVTTGYVTIQDSTGTTYKVLVAT